MDLERIINLTCTCGNKGIENFDFHILKRVKKDGNPYKDEDWIFINPYVLDIVCKNVLRLLL